MTATETARSSRCAAISKAFGAVQALQDVDLRLMPGEILGLVGDNSAGKSTLMKILSGAYQTDTGEILIEGEPSHFRSPHESRGARHRDDLPGLRAVREHGHRVEHVPGRWPTKGLFVDRGRMEAEAGGC